MKKFLISIVCCACIIFGCAFFLSANDSARAESNLTFTAKNYTDSDKLLTHDGKLLEKDIETFAEQTNALANGAVVDELDMVIPRAYLESSTDGIYQYYGKEYGFYMIRDGKYFDLLLINFLFEMESVDPATYNTFKIKVEPILQQSFVREGNEGNYKYKKHNGRPLEYCVYNPRFENCLYNENEFNFGDDGYIKQADGGITIRQVEPRYEYIDFITGEESNATSVDIDLCVDYSHKYGDRSPTLIGEIRDLVAHADDLKTQDKYVAISEVKGSKFCTLPTKSYQQGEEKYPSFSRKALVAPTGENRIVLSSKDFSYAECIIMVNDTYANARIYQRCEFDIVSVRKSDGVVEHVAGNWQNANATPLQFEKEHVIDRHYNTTSISQKECDGKTQVPVYFLPYGKREIEFTPEYTGTYKFTLSQNLGMSIEDETYQKQGDYHVVSLVSGKTYTLTVKNLVGERQVNAYFIFSFDCAPLGQTATVGAENNCVFKYSATETRYLHFVANSENFTLKIFDENFTLIKEDNASNLVIYVNAGKTYLVVATNVSQSEQPCTITANTLPDISVGEGQLDAVNKSKIVQFTNDSNEPKQYELHISGANTSAHPYDERGGGDSMTVYVVNKEEVVFIGLDAGETCYIEFKGNGNIAYNFCERQVQMRWVVEWKDEEGDHQIITANNAITLSKNCEYRVYLMLIENGEILNKYIYYSCREEEPSFDIVYGNNVLSISDNVKKGTIFYMAAYIGTSDTIDDIVPSLKIEVE